MIKMGSFRSYVGLDEYEMTTHRPLEEAVVQPKFLNGELVVAEAQQVIKFTSLEKKNGVLGCLFVTNARLVFVSSDQVCQEVSVPLLSIHTLCHYEDEKRKVKHKIKLVPSGSNPTALFSSASSRIYEIFVVCSNFRTLNLSFRLSPIDQGKKICNAILHHAIPVPLDRLFYFDFCKVTDKEYDGVYSKHVGVPYFDLALDWHKELKFTRTPAYRVSDINESFAVCETLPEWIVVPAGINDSRLSNLAEKLKGNRPPFWVWGDYRGAAIIRMGKLHNEADSSSESTFFEIIRNSRTDKSPVRIEDVESIFPVKDIKTSFNRLLELCCPESPTQYDEADARFLSNLENSKWLWWVSRVLQLSGDLAEFVTKQPEVIILQENESRDMSCVIGSLIQVIVDPRFRTAIGLFSLIQKDWIAAGHPFHSGYLHTSPLFLLFLDAVFQLCYQNPFQFEFNEILLVEIWDCVFDTTSGTFLFDSPAQRKTLETRKDLSVWQKLLQTNNESAKSPPDTLAGKRALQSATKSFLFPESPSLRPAYLLNLPQLPQKFANPMYKMRTLLFPPGRDVHSKNFLYCSSCMCDIQIWTALYLYRARDSSLSNGTGGELNCSLTSFTGETSTSESRNSSVSSASPVETTSFIYCGANQTKTGSDPSIELKLVDVLLATLSSNNRYPGDSRSRGAKSSSSPVRINPFSTKF